MNILRFYPVFKDYIWGGTKLNDVFKKNTGMSYTAESWELSSHPDGESRVKGGKYDGITLSEYVKSNPEVLGTNRKTDEVPILIKLIDAKDNLSIQVHPDDNMAKKLENQNGKTEMWYIIDSDEDSEIICGVKNTMSGDELKEAILNNTVIDKLNSVTSKKGDVFFVESGTIHAICKGNLIAEIQQNSNVTYRLYDYDRRDSNGNPRQLHIEKGIQASDCKKYTERCIPTASDSTRLIASCDYFAVKELVVSQSAEFCCRPESYQALLVVDGSLELNKGNESELIRSGETVFLPAGFGVYKLYGSGTVLITENPPKYYVGIDLGGTNIASAVVDEFGVIYGRSTRKTLAPRPYNEIFDDMNLCARDAAVNSGIKWENIESVGIGCPGAINKETGYIDFSNNLDFYDVPIVEYMEKALGKTVYVENDANSAAWGEFVVGSGKDTDNMILLTLGTGVGSGIIINGHLFRGSFGTGAELGHMVIISNGEKCTCGRYGCLESYASATALSNQAKQAVVNNPDCEIAKLCNGDASLINGKMVFSASDNVAKCVVDTYLSYLSEGIVNIVNMFQPEVICLGGGVSGAGDRILQPIQQTIEERAFARFGNKHPQVKIASLGNDAGIIGAALLWKDM